MGSLLHFPNISSFNSTISPWSKYVLLFLFDRQGNQGTEGLRSLPRVPQLERPGSAPRLSSTTTGALAHVSTLTRPGGADSQLPRVREMPASVVLMYTHIPAKAWLSEALPYHGPPPRAQTHPERVPLSRNQECSMARSFPNELLGFLFYFFNFFFLF